MIPSLDRASPPLVKTKFLAPRLRAGLVSRPRLLQLLAQGLTGTLTLVCAPAGYGKTTLLAEWLTGLNQTAETARPALCWLSFDANDDDPALFLRSLIAALDKYLPPVDSAARAVLSVYPQPPVQTVLGLLINDLVDQSCPPGGLVLVLDDYQFITQPALHAGMAFLLDHLPAQVHLVILTRSDPPIPLARLRARGQLAEIRADDLRFTSAESTCLLNQALGFELTVEHVAQLDERTEGWAAGLQMAALALAGQPNAAAFVQNFSGSHRYILDYLVEEVLHRQPEEIQEFLLQTSILDHLSGPLCDAVMANRAPSSDGFRASQQILEYLDRANLFLISLDSERTWFRYHHLFADLLRARLDQQDPQRRRELHRQASRWYVQNQRIPEAIDHALAGGEAQRACDLVEAQVPYRITHNGMLLLLGWIRKLPPEMALNRPWLCIAQAWSLMFTNEVDKAEPLLQAAERNIAPDGPADLQREWRGQIACLRAAFAADIFGESQRTIAMAQQALDCLPPSDVVTRTYAKYLLGRTYFLCGELALALPMLLENLRECIAAEATNYYAPTLGMLAKIYRMQGRLRDAAALLREGCAYLEAHDPRQVTVAGIAFTGLADVLREWNQLEEAEALACRALDLLLPWENPSSICACHLLRSRIFLTQGRLAEAAAALSSAAGILRGRRPIAGVVSDLDHAQVRFWLASGDVPQAKQWALAYQNRPPSDHPHFLTQEQDELTLARVRIADGQTQLALETLQRLDETAAADGRAGRLIEIRILQSLALQAGGRPEMAARLLDSALALAEPEGCQRIFLDEGEPLRALLAAAPKHRAYAQKILAESGAARPAGEPAQTGLIEALTPREADVLRGMAEGLSNQEIAQKLFLAEGTVKYYVHVILEKLAVHSRTQAIIAAKKHQLI